MPNFGPDQPRGVGIGAPKYVIFHDFRGYIIMLIMAKFGVEDYTLDPLSHETLANIGEGVGLCT